MSQSCRGATLVQPEKIEIREYPLPDIPPDGGLVAVERERGGVADLVTVFIFALTASAPLLY